MCIVTLKNKFDIIVFLNEIEIKMTMSYLFTNPRQWFCVLVHLSEYKVDNFLAGHGVPYSITSNHHELVLNHKTTVTRVLDAE